MRRKLSSVLIAFGVLMILGAAGLLLYNRQESEQAASFSARVLPELSE
jgi:LPXTG-motif cell wall-anchored protein